MTAPHAAVPQGAVPYGAVPQGAAPPTAVHPTMAPRKPAPKPHKRKGPPLSESLMGEIVEEFLKTRSIYTTALVLDCSRSTVRRYVVNAGLSSMISSSWGRRNLTLGLPSKESEQALDAQNEQIGY